MMNNTKTFTNELKDDQLNTIVGGSCQIISAGSTSGVSGSTPKWAVGDVLRVLYNDDASGKHRAKCTVWEVSSACNGGLTGMEYTYTIQIVWLPASCPAAQTDIGKFYYNVAESSLCRD